MLKVRIGTATVNGTQVRWKDVSKFNEYATRITPSLAPSAKVTSIDEAKGKKTGTA
jgi:hypothetical protein